MESDQAVRPCDGVSRWARARAGFGAVAVWSVWVGATLASIWYIRQHARNVPYFDDFAMVSVMTGHEPLSYEWASAQYNEHRNVIPRLIQVALLRVIPDFCAAMYLNAGLLAAAAASAIVVARRVRGRTSVVDAVLPLSILTLGQCECLLVGFALNLVMTAWISWRLIAIFGDASRPPGWWSCLRIGAALVILPLCGGSGMAMLPPLWLWLAGYAACGWWSGRKPGPWTRAIGLGSVIIATAAIAWYLVGYKRPPHLPSAPSLSAIGATALEFTSLVIVPMGQFDRWWPGLAVVLLSAATAFLLGDVARKEPDQRPRALGLLAVLLSTMGVAASIGYSRSGLGTGGGGLSRYITISMPTLGAAYFAWLLYGPPLARRAIHIALLAMVCAGIPSQVWFARSVGEGRRDVYVRIETGLQFGMRPARLLNLACPALYPDRAATHQYFRMLKDSGVGMFRFFADGEPAVAGRPVPDTIRR